MLTSADMRAYQRAIVTRALIAFVARALPSWRSVRAKIT